MTCPRAIAAARRIQAEKAKLAAALSRPDGEDDATRIAEAIQRDATAAKRGGYFANLCNALEAQRMGFL